MKKLMIIVLMLFFMTPMVLKACTLANPPSGFEIEIKNCEYGDDAEYYFDVLFEKEGQDYNTFLKLNQVNQSFGDVEPTTLEEPLDYMSIDNDFISYLGYSSNVKSAYHNGCFQGILIDQIFEKNDPNPYEYDDFKLIVLDEDFNEIHRSQVFKKNILPGEGENYTRFIYNPVTNEFELEEREMSFPTIEDCGLFYSNPGLWAFLGFGMIGLIILVLLIELITYIKIDLNLKLAVFIISLDIFIFMSIMFMQTFMILQTVFGASFALALQALKYYVIKTETTISKILLIVFSCIIAVLPLLMYLLQLYLW